MELTKINDKIILSEQNNEIETYDFNKEITFSKLTKNLLSKNLSEPISLKIINPEELNENEQTLAHIVQEIVENYNKTLNDIHYIDTLDGDYINCITFNTWEYLASNKQCGTNSTYIYFWYKDQYENAYDLYASIHQEKKPWVYLDYQTPFDIDEKDDWMKQFTKVKELENGILYQ